MRAIGSPDQADDRVETMPFGAAYPLNGRFSGSGTRLMDVTARPVVCLIGLLVLWALIVSPCAAANSGQVVVKEQRLQQLRTRIDELKSELGSVRGKKSNVDAELEKTEKEIGAVASTLRELRGRIAESQARLDELEAQRDAGRRNLRGMQSELARDLRAAYAMGQQRQPVKLLLDQDDPAVIARLMIYYSYFSRQRAQRIGRIKSVLDDLGRVEQEVRRQNADLEKLNANQLAEAKRLEAVRAERQAVVTRLQAELKEKSSALTALQHDEKSLQQLVESLRRALSAVPAAGTRYNSLSPLKGKLVWPVDGRISIPFDSLQADGKLRSRGVLVNASAGADVHAIASGTVVFADWLRGFGLLLIIDHGKGYMSLYGYNRSLFRGVGDKVEAGDVIAAVGDSGGRKRPGLYLELRKDGRPFDPVPWFAGKPSPLRAGN